MNIGDKVETMTKRKPVCHGVVKTLSACGRYAIVRKVYGTRCQWDEYYRTADLRPLTVRRNRDKAPNAGTEARVPPSPPVTVGHSESKGA